MSNTLSRFRKRMRAKHEKDCDKKTKVRRILQSHSWSYYVISILIIVIIFWKVRPYIMSLMAEKEVHAITGTSYKFVQNDDAIKKYIVPYVYTKSIAVSSFLSLIIVFVVTIMYAKLRAFAPRLDKVNVILAIVIAISAVYTYGYNASKEILLLNPGYFNEVIERSSGMSNEPDSVLELSVKAERADETANEIKNDNSSSRNTGATESEEVKGEDYIVEISGKRTDGAYTASKYNNLISTFPTS